MAPSESPKEFRKLQLNTHTSSRPISSSFASITQDDRHSSPRPNGVVRSQRPPLSPSELENLGLQYSEARLEPSGYFPRSLDEQAVSSGSDEPGLDEKFQSRKTSISFNPQVTLDGGKQASLDKPLPKSAMDDDGESSARSIEIPTPNGHFGHRSHSEAEMSRFDRETGRPLDRRKGGRAVYRQGERRHPLLQSTVNDLAADPEYADHEHIASLTSATTASPNMEEVRTPVDPSADYLLSPLPTSSPIDFPSQNTTGAWLLSRRTSSQRSRSYNRADNARAGSVRKASGRRNTTRSATSSMSPASAFLSKWGREEAIAVTEPDDEGQEIGSSSQWIIGRQIGYGGFSVVKEVHTFTQEGVKRQCAVKIVRKQVAGKSEEENEKLQTAFEHEVSIWRFLKHPYILPLIEVWDSPFATFCITELKTGGTLFDIIRANRKAGHMGLKPNIAKRYLYQLASALRYLHEDVRVVHRDVKLENCLVDMSKPDASTQGGNILLCDFGMADFVTNEHRTSPEPEDPHLNVGPAETSMNVQGSLQYTAPELVRAKCPIFSPAVDIWAFGVIAYTLMTSELPFQHQFEPRLVAMILAGKYNLELLWQCPAVKEAPAETVELVRGCLEMDPQLRWSISDVLECRLFEGCPELYEDTSDSAWS